MAGPFRRIAVFLSVAGACVLAAGCGGGSDSATVHQSSSPLGSPEPPANQQPLSPAEQHGQDLFVKHCGSCHTLAAAGTIGQIGPNLENIPVNEAGVLRAIRIGGGPHRRGTEATRGVMPRNLVTGKDARDVAAFVAANASGSSTP
jgi:cytochrome c551